MLGAPSPIVQRIRKLQSHLERENPVLLDVVKSFRQLDRVAYHLGMLDRDDSFATKVPWWPMVSVLGTFSSGKSTFLNGYLGEKLQKTGNQAVDDKFTVICFGSDDNARVLPGRALDADPRFPFYQMSQAIEEVAPGEGERIDTYLQLKTCRSETLRGKIFIDSPGFDADEQRNSTLRITDRIIDLSDLVLVFFDARHPEPGAMRDTLDHLVSKTIARQDSGKFLYILNQLDTTAREDNPEEVVAAWQRALGERGLTAGRFYTIYNQEAANPIPDEALRRRFESKRDNDLNEIHERMEQVEIERAYRIVGSLEKVARAFEAKTVPALQGILDRWRRRTLIGDVIAAGLLIALFLGVTNQLGQWDGMQLKAAWWDYISATPMRLYFAALGAYVVWLLVHFGVRKLAATSLMSAAERVGQQLGIRGSLKEAFRINTRPWHSIFSRHPVGWSRRSRRHAQKVLEDADRYVQDLNDRFTNPSGNTPVEFTAAPLDEYDRDSIDAPAPARAGTAD